jgi:hypothetical protein
VHVARGIDIRYVGDGLARAVEIALDAGRREVFDDTQRMTARDVVAVQRAGQQHAAVRMRKRKNLQVLRGKDHMVMIAAGGKHFDAAGCRFEWLRGGEAHDGHRRRKAAVLPREREVNFDGGGALHGGCGA